MAVEPLTKGDVLMIRWLRMGERRYLVIGARPAPSGGVTYDLLPDPEDE